MCGAHQLGPNLGDWLLRLGYYWPKMIPDAIASAKRCHACQIHGDFIDQAPRHLCPTTSSWPFEMWGVDMVGPISPPSSKRHQFILIITDYFSKWAEARPQNRVSTTASDVSRVTFLHKPRVTSAPISWRPRPPASWRSRPLTNWRLRLFDNWGPRPLNKLKVASLWQPRSASPQ